MPVAVAKTNEVVRKDLESLEGAYVELRQLSFDEILERRDKAMHMSMETRSGKQRRKGEKIKMQFESAMQWTRWFEFSRCIVDHNLELEPGKKMDFDQPNTLKVLDPKVAMEIERYIEDMNLEDDEVDEDFIRQLSSSSKTGENKQKENTEKN